jgi:hypothetical protein
MSRVSYAHCVDEHAITRDRRHVPAAVFYVVVSTAHVVAGLAVAGIAPLMLFGVIDGSARAWGYAFAVAAVALEPLVWVAAQQYVRYQPPLGELPALSARDRRLVWAELFFIPVLLLALAYVDVGAALVFAGAMVRLVVGMLCVLRRGTWAAFTPLVYLNLGRS